MLSVYWTLRCRTLPLISVICCSKLATACRMLEDLQQLQTFVQHSIGQSLLIYLCAFLYARR